MVNQQGTLLSFNNRTSETASEITFIFNNYLNQKVQHKEINKRFLEWFIGFTEGKGSFIVLNNKVYFDISVSIKDIQVIYYIKKELGFGKVIIKDSAHHDPSGGTVTFYITSRDNFYRLVSLFNGNLCTVNKKQEFKNWLEVFNSQYSKEILFIDRDIKPSLKTGWFSGYIDAIAKFISSIENKELNSCKAPSEAYGHEGLVQAPRRTATPSLTKYAGVAKLQDIYFSFSIAFFLKKKKDEFYILNDISVMLNISIKNIKYNQDKQGWILSIYSFKKLKLIVNYLKRYPLKTKKSLVFTKWCKYITLL